MRALLAFLAALLPLSTIAQSPKTEWPEGSAMHTGLKYLEVQRHFEGLLNGEYEKLIELVGKRDDLRDRPLIQAIKAQRDEWLKYRNAECELIGLLSGASGSWPSTYATQCAATLTEQRYRTVSAVLRCVEDLSREETPGEQNRCLHRLAGPAVAK